MSRLEIEDDEKLSINEYIKRKKGQRKPFNKKSKITIVVIIVITLLSIYTIIQLHIYNKFRYRNNIDESVKNQKNYGIYYLTKGYTYEPNYSLNYINTDGSSDNTVYLDLNFNNIYEKNNNIYGTKNDGVYKFNVKNKEITKIYDNAISNMYIYGDIIYAVRKSDKKLLSINLLTNEIKEFNISNVSEILSDGNYIYVSVLASKKRQIERYDLNGENKLILTKYANVSYMAIYNEKIYFSNKEDEGKIYVVDTDGQNEGKFSDSKMVMDNGEIEESCINKQIEIENGVLLYINAGDNNSLWKINIQTKNDEKIIYSIVEYIQVVNDTVLYKTKNEASIYLYNYNTSFTSEVIKNKAVKFCIVD